MMSKKSNKNNRKRTNKKGKKERNKKAVSEMVAYAMIIAIAMSIGLVVYKWLEGQTPGTSPECQEGVSLIISNYLCGKDSNDNKKKIRLTLQNKGRFDIPGMYIKMANEIERIPTLNFKNEDDEEVDKIEFEESGSQEPLPPGETYKQVLVYEEHNQIKRIEIQPFRYEEGDELICKEAVFVQNIEGCGANPGVWPICGNGQIERDEVCDGTNLGGKTCQNLDLGFVSGDLKCSPDCKSFDTSWCVSGGGGGGDGYTCPDGICDEGENCPEDALSGCPDTECYTPTCTNGCGSEPVSKFNSDESCIYPAYCDGNGHCCGDSKCDKGEICNSERTGTSNDCTLETWCDDGVDNDEDSFTDCNDYSDCGYKSECLY